jgi:hypothetical protein
MRNPLFSLPTYRLTSGLLLATFVASCGDTETKESPVRDLPGVILLDTGDDGDNVPLEDESPPAGFSSYGFWYTYHDIGACENTAEPNPDTEATMVPAQGSNLTTTPYAAIGIQPPPEQLPNAPDNTHGIRFSGGGQEYFGAGLGFKLEKAYADSNNQGMDFVAAGIVGFRFWAYSSIDSDYIFKVQDLYSTPEAGKCVPRGPFPACEGPQNCENAPATGNIIPGTAPEVSVPNIEVGPTWKLFEVYLTTQVADDPNTPAVEIGPLLRSNWDGIDTSTPPRDIKELPAEPAHIFQLQFQTASAPGETGQFDLIIDNFGFILAGN